MVIPVIPPFGDTAYEKKSAVGNHGNQVGWMKIGNSVVEAKNGTPGIKIKEYYIATTAGKNKDNYLVEYSRSNSDINMREKRISEQELTFFKEKSNKDLIYPELLFD